MFGFDTKLLNIGASSLSKYYRPIYIVCHIAKPMEKRVQKQFLDYLVLHAFIATDQSAYIQRYSTQTSLYKVSAQC